MVKKVVLTGFIASLLFVILIAYSLPALAQNEHATIPDLPEDASFHAIPFKETIFEANGLYAVLKPLITTTNNPDQYLAGPEFDGVPVLLLPRTDIPEGFVAVCTGTLLPTGQHILTAAHCVTDEDGNLILKENAGAQARFGNDIDDDSNKFYIDVSNTQVHDEWVGSIYAGNDLAVLVLLSEAEDFTTYSIFDGDQQTELVDTHITIHKVGFGRTGTLDQGDVIDLGIKRDGTNRLDDTGDAFRNYFNIPGTTGGLLMYDSDNGNPDNDAFGDLLGISDTGIGSDEVMTAGGDSGGPGFYLNPDTGFYEIISVSSFGATVGGSRGTDTADCHKNIRPGGFNSPDSSCGEFGGDVSAITNKDFIQNAMTVLPVEDLTAPDAPTLVSPGDVTTGNDSTPTFDWNVVFDISGVAYELLVDDNSDFLTPVISQTGLTDSTFTPVTDLSDNTFSWKVRAIDGAGNEGSWSSVWSFTIDTSGGDVGGEVIVSAISSPEIAKGQTLEGVTISGSGFNAGASVTFENGCGPSPSATNVNFVSSASLTVEITAKNGGPNKDCTFDVRVTNLDTSSGVKENLFTVTP